VETLGSDHRVTDVKELQEDNPVAYQVRSIDSPQITKVLLHIQGMH
jgi:hypothetical protein